MQASPYWGVFAAKGTGKEVFLGGLLTLLETERRLASSKETGKPVGEQLRRRGLWAEPGAGDACFERRVNAPMVTGRGEQLQCRQARTGGFRGKRDWKGAFFGGTFDSFGDRKAASRL